jgi:hypothetical protein
LALVALVVRRLLRLGTVEKPLRSPTAALGPESEILYAQVCQEIEASVTMVAVSLNDAIEEQRAGRAELAGELFSLAIKEWTRLAEVVEGLQALTLRHLILMQYAVPLRPLTSQHFRSQIMVEHVRFHALLDQFVFRPRLRFQLHVRILRHASQILTEEFRRCNPATGAASGRGSNLDYFFHDFDLVAKESLVVFRALLACLPDSVIPSLAQEAAFVVNGSAVGHSRPARFGVSS